MAVIHSDFSWSVWHNSQYLRVGVVTVKHRFFKEQSRTVVERVSWIVPNS